MPERVTFAGSMMPRSVMSPNSCSNASYPYPKSVCSSTFSTIISPFRPAFSAILASGARMAPATISAPFSSSSARFASAQVCRSCERWQRAVPPPGSTPSSTAALVALMASSRRSFLSLSSVSVVAPTLTMATPPTSFARRFSSCSLVYELFVSSICALICWQRSSSASLGASATIVVESFLTVARLAWPKSSSCTLSRLSPSSLVM
mmetsp:Transcript_96563/g.262308  ORF Transcript_96563/g.262308 Transcript_96563/m.262308 type:complete len:207 (+) Transcript_96563:377-997(+)